MFTLLCLLLTGRAVAQVVQGRVTDAATGETLPMAHVYYADRRAEAVATDMDGRYRIPFRSGTLVFSMVGYDTRAVEVKRAQRLDVRLKEKYSDMQEVSVVAKRKRYRRRENPAVEMMRRVIAAKDSNSLRSRDFLSYNKYEKMTLALDEVTDKILQDDHFRKLPYLKNHVDTCPETGKLILPLTVDEKASRVIYRKSPRQEKTIVEGQRSDGISKLITSGNILTGMMADCFTDVDIYQDQVRLLQYPFTSPISSASAISFYRYFIVDTLMVERDKCYRIDFTPNNPQDFGFSGTLFIMADSTWRVRRAEIGIPSRSDVNFVREMRVMQDFHTLPTGEQVVTSSRMLVRMALVSWLQKVQVERVVHCSGWDFAPIRMGVCFRRRHQAGTLLTVARQCVLAGRPSRTAHTHRGRYGPAPAPVLFHPRLQAIALVGKGFHRELCGDKHPSRPSQQGGYRSRELYAGYQLRGGIPSEGKCTDHSKPPSAPVLARKPQIRLW